MEYGDAGTPDQAAPERAAMRARNLLGQLHRHHDEAGLTDGGGGRLQGQCARQIPPRHRRRADPRGLRAGAGQRLAASRPSRSIGSRGRSRRSPSAKASSWRATAYRTTSSYDALNRIKRLQFPQDVEGQAPGAAPDLQPRRRAGASLPGRHRSMSSASPTTPRASARSSPTATA